MIKELENHFATFRTTTDSGKNYQWIFKLPGKVRKGIGYLLKLLNNYKEEKPSEWSTLADTQCSKSTSSIIG